MSWVQLACPKDHARLQRESESSLICAHGHSYPVIDSVPVLLRDDVQQTMPLAKASIERAKNTPGEADQRNPDLFLESLGISEAEKALAVALARRLNTRIDPVVSVIVGATGGHSYKSLIGNLETYPIPDIRLPSGGGKLLLDVGCNWGRWSLSAANKGYRVIGMDPSLGAVMAARRVARQLHFDIEYIVADTRYLPFEAEGFDTVFSYNVIQHLSKIDAAGAISEIGRVLKPAGNCLVQLAHAYGIRSLYHQFRRRFREPRNFEVRYWTIPEVLRSFQKEIGPSKISVDCYFGLGLQASARDLMPRHMAWIITASETLRSFSSRVHALTYLADSVYVSSAKLQNRAGYAGSCLTS